jgi:hypothetical protein
MPSKFFQRYQWIGIAAPFIAGSIITLANEHQWYAALLFGLGAVCLYIEGAYVMRVRWRLPFYRLRNLKIEGMVLSREAVPAPGWPAGLRPSRC